jgi:hypothetical protein
MKSNQTGSLHPVSQQTFQFRNILPGPKQITSMPSVLLVPRKATTRRGYLITARMIALSRFVARVNLLMLGKGSFPSEAFPTSRIVAIIWLLADMSKLVLLETKTLLEGLPTPGGSHSYGLSLVELSDVF